MKKIISFKIASKASLVIYGIIWIFHLVLIIGGGILDFIPINIVWGGKIETKEQLILFETIALVIITICFLLTLIKSGYLNISKLYSISHYAMWLFFAYFLLNTIGNILSETIFEKSMAILSILLSIFTLRLALKKNKEN